MQVQTIEMYGMK